MTIRPKIAVFSAGLLAVFFGLVFWLVPFSPRTDVLTEQSKAWFDVLRAAQSIQTVQGPRGESVGAYGELNPDQARSFVESNRVLLASVRMGVQKELLVPVEASREWLDAHAGDMAKIKQLVHSLITEGKVAEADGNTDEAVAIYLDALTLSYKVVRGGIRLDYLYGLSYKALVFRAIEEIVPKLTTEQCQRVLLMLDKLEKEQESLRSIAFRERAWRNKVFGLNIRSTVSAMVKTRSWYPELNPNMRASFDQNISSVRKKLVDRIEANSSR